jgi:hypothetical protein
MAIDPLFLFALPQIALPQIDLSDSFAPVTTLANQLAAVIAGAIAHPFWAIALFVVAIVALQIVADLIKRLLKAGLSFVFRLPVNVSQWVWHRAIAPTSAPTRVEFLLARLDALRLEQDEVLTELKTLLATAEKRAGRNLSPNEPTLSTTTSTTPLSTDIVTGDA